MRPKAVGDVNFGLQDNASCPTVNKYPYGLEQLVSYAKGIGANAIKENFPNKNITYLLAGGIVSDPFLDANCAAAAQGGSRLERGKNYERHIFTSFGDLAQNSQKFVRVPNAGYDPVSMYGSYCGLSVLFGDGECSSQATQR